MSDPFIEEIPQNVPGSRKSNASNQDLLDLPEE